MAASLLTHTQTIINSTSMSECVSESQIEALVSALHRCLRDPLFSFMYSSPTKLIRALQIKRRLFSVRAAGCFSVTYLVFQTHHNGTHHPTKRTETLLMMKATEDAHKYGSLLKAPSSSVLCLIRAWVAASANKTAEIKEDSATNFGNGSWAHNGFLVLCTEAQWFTDITQRWVVIKDMSEMEQGPIWEKDKWLAWFKASPIFISVLARSTERPLLQLSFVRNEATGNWITTRPSSGQDHISSGLRSRPRIQSSHAVDKEATVEMDEGICCGRNLEYLVMWQVYRSSVLQNYWQHNLDLFELYLKCFILSILNGDGYASAFWAGPHLPMQSSLSAMLGTINSSLQFFLRCKEDQMFTAISLLILRLVPILLSEGRLCIKICFLKWVLKLVKA